MQDTENAKLGFIRAYFDEEERKLVRLDELDSLGYSEEAFVLCLIYIDRLAQKLYWPSTKTGYNFVRALSEYSGDQELGLVHPKQLTERLRKLKAEWQPIADAVENRFTGPEYELLSATPLEAELATSLSEQQVSMLHDEVWRGTIAGVAYWWIRNPAVHGIGASPRLTFNNTTLTGQAARPLDFNRLRAALTNLLAEARRRSETTNQWYGDDRVLA